MEVVGPRSASAIPKKETCFTTIRRHFIGSGRSQAVWISPGPEEYVYAGKYRPSKSPLISYRSPVISVSSNGGGRLRWTQWLIDGSFWAQIWTRDTLGDASAQMTELLCEPVRICAQNEPSISHRVHISVCWAVRKFPVPFGRFVLHIFPSDTLICWKIFLEILEFP